MHNKTPHNWIKKTTQRNGLKIDPFTLQRTIKLQIHLPSKAELQWAATCEEGATAKENLGHCYFYCHLIEKI